MKVLIADDNCDSVESLAMLCETWGFEPVVAYDGQAAFDLLHQPNPPMLCLLDWEMPGLTGIDLCAEIRRERDRPYRYLILITGRDESSALLTGLDAGADEFLMKPVNPEELRARLTTGKRVLTLQSQLLQSMENLQALATRDGLTDLWNRTAILEILNREMARSNREMQPLSITLVDIDHFKAVNDTRGHLAGDSVLRQVAQRLAASLRSYDSVGRYGGEEFLIVFPNCSAAESLRLTDRLRRCVQDEWFTVPGGNITVTASLGVATWNGTASALELLRSADEALYQAKDSGRNRVACATSPTRAGKNGADN